MGEPPPRFVFRRTGGCDTETFHPKLLSVENSPPPIPGGHPFICNILLHGVKEFGVFDKTARRSTRAGGSTQSESPCKRAVVEKLSIPDDGRDNS